jgi:superfamily II DNA or RNA helicase
MMQSINQILKDFDHKTIARSKEYVNQIRPTDLAYTKHTNGAMKVIAFVRGQYEYETELQYDHQGTLDEAYCSCPVGYFCKHGAALAQVVYRQQLETQEAERKDLFIKNSTHQQLQNEANIWLESLAKDIQPEKKQLEGFIFVYVINYPPNRQTKQIGIELYKVRRIKSGEIREAKLYTDYDNIIRQRIKTSPRERELVARLHSYYQSASFYHFNKPILLQGLSQSLLRDVIETECCYWQSYEHAALTWSAQSYDLAFEWQKDDVNQTEQLTAIFSKENQRTTLEQAQSIQILQTEPLSYLDLDLGCIGTLNTRYPASMLEKLLDAPKIPTMLMPKLDQILMQQSAIQSLPRPQTLQEIPLHQGKVIPVLSMNQTVKFFQIDASLPIALGQIYFDYDTGRVASDSPQQDFLGLVNGKTVRQQRDFNAEKESIAQLLKHIPELEWLHENKNLGYGSLRAKNILFAHIVDWLPHFLDKTTFETLGWRVEHAKNSLLNVQAVQSIQLSMVEDQHNNDWFNVGMSVTDSQGKDHSLIDLLGDAIQHNPRLIDPAVLEKITDEGHLLVSMKGQPSLALPFKDIRPILLHLVDLFNRDQSDGKLRVDRYDAMHLLDLQHHLGMPWQTSERLYQLAGKFRAGYQQHCPTPEGFQGELRGYQQQGLAWLQFLRETEHGGVLADDMGLGKTAQTLAHILLEKQAGRLEHPALIIAPTSLMQNWRNEAQKFTPELTVLTLHGANRNVDFDKIDSYDIVLSTYPLLSRDEEVLLQHRYHLLILDEAQNIKNPISKASQVARKLNATHRLCLTGTPMENHLGELWALFHFIMPGFLGSQEVFNKRFRNPIEKQGLTPPKNTLAGRIRPFMLRRLKTEVATELPAKTTIAINIDMTDAQKKLYEAVRATMQKNIQQHIAENGFKRSQIQILDALLKLRQVCCHPSLLKLDSTPKNITSAKYNQLLEMVSEMVEEGRRILIFSQFTSMLSLIEDGLNKLSIDFVKLTGQTKKRDAAIQAFQDGQVPVFLISLKAGGVGLNLTAADTVIHYDPWWNPAAEDQASDRAWRIGQDKPVFVYKLIMNHSIEEKILIMQQRKASLSQAVLSHDNEQSIKFSENELLQLFEPIV